MSGAGALVRCYNCGRRAARDSPQCGRCGAAFRALCTCGADICIYDDQCVQCSTPHVPRRLPASMHPYARAARWTLLAAAAAFGAHAFFAPREVPVWKRKAQAYRSFVREDLDSATAGYRDVVERSPTDAEGLYMYAVCLRRTGASPDVFLPLAEKAAAAAPREFLSPILRFLARCEIEAGRLDRALGHAEACARLKGDDGTSLRLVADIEMRRARPDLPRVLDALERARAAGVDTPELTLMLADVSLRIYGPAAAGSGRLPQRVAATLEGALASLDSSAPRDDDAATIAAKRARLLLALGRHDEAFVAADRALNRLPKDAPKPRTGEIRLLRAMALHARGERAGAASEFAAALAGSHETRVAAAAAAFLVGAGDGETAVKLLTRAAEDDPTGSVRAVLAGLYLRLGRFDEAADAIAAARALAPDSASCAETQGAVAVARGRPDEARTAYADAVRLAPTLVGPRVGQALASLTGVVGAGRRQALARAAEDLRALRKEYGDDPCVLSALGRVLLSADDVDGAREALERAKDAAPADPAVWRTLAAARRRSAAPDAAASAADAYARARSAAGDDVELVVAEAEARLDAGEEAAAVAACTDHLRRRPDEPEILALRAQAYRRLAMWPSAAADLRKLFAARRDDESVLAQLVDAMFRAGDVEGARRVVAEAAPRVSPVAAHVLEFLSTLHGGDLPQAVEKLGLAGPTTLLAEVQLAAGRRDDAVDTLRRRRVDRPDDAYAARLLVFVLLDEDAPSTQRIVEARTAAAALPADAPAGLAELLAGRLLLAEGDATAAAARLADAARAAPMDAFAALYLGEALFRSGRRDESLASFRRAATAPGSPPRLRAIAASRLLAASYSAPDDAAAEGLVREAMRFAPQDAVAAERLVELLRARGAAAEAAETAEHALLTPGLAAAQSTRLRCLAACERMANGQIAEAGALLDGLDPGARSSPAALLLRGFADLVSKDFERADGRFVAVLAADPTWSAAQLGRIESALALGKKAVASELYSDWRARHADDRAFVVAATRFFVRAGHVDVAAAMIQVASTAAPDDAVLGEECARTLVAAGRRAEGVAAFRAVAARAPVDTREACLLKVGAYMLASPELAPDAVALAKSVASATTPDGPVGLEARVLESEALLATGKLSEAEVAAQAVAKRWDRAATPPSERTLEARVRFVLGSSAASEPRRHGEAVKQLTKCLALAPSDEAATNNLAGLLGRRTTSAAEGAALAKKLTARRPDAPEYWDTRAACSAAADDAADAESSWRRALDIFARSSGADPAARARTALRFAKFLASKDRAADARGVVRPALEYAKSTSEEAEIRRFLAESGGD